MGGGDYFDEPVIVEDEFFMLGTHRSNYDEPYDGYPYTYFETVYAYLNLNRDPCIEDSCLSSHRWFISERDKLNRIEYQETFQSYLRPCGPFLAIVDYYDLEVRTADSTLYCDFFWPGFKENVYLCSQRVLVYTPRK